jgi:hypothetical protein
VEGVPIEISIAYGNFHEKNVAYATGSMYVFMRNFAGIAGNIF